MIDLKSLRPVAALCPDSPEGCGRLAGDNIPGNRSRCPRALKGRRRGLICFPISPSLCPRSPDIWTLAPEIALVRRCQPISIQFLASIPASMREQSVFVRVHPWLNSLFCIPAPPNPNPKSTAGYPKSTVDLWLEPLIWGKNGLQTPSLSLFRYSFCLTMARELWKPNQMQTETGQKMNPLPRVPCPVHYPPRQRSFLFSLTHRHFHRIFLL